MTPESFPLKDNLLRKEQAIGVLVSGGVDSCVLVAECAQSFAAAVPIYVRTGLYWEKSELYWLQKFLQSIHSLSLKDLVILDLPVGAIYKSHWSITGLNTPGFNDEDETVYLPGRNIVLLSVSTVYCVSHGLKGIALGSLSGNPFPDATDMFFRSMENTVREGMNAEFTIIAPYRTFKKKEVILRGKDLPLELTFSCLNPQNHDHCGMCSKCAERIHAFGETGIKDRTIYNQQHS